MATWTCQRSAGGERCAHVNPARKRKCESCGRERPARKRPAHMAALDIPYEEYIVLNGGEERCAICRRERDPGGRRLQRDHDHRTGMPRGLLCFACNRWLRNFMTVEWLRAAIAYLERAEARSSRTRGDDS